jgi:hypothetical protein
MISSLAYRSPPVTSRRCLETAERLKSAFGSRREPLLDCILSDALIFNEAVPLFMRKIAEMVTGWYTPYLVQEIKQARDYDEAIAPASLLAFSENELCIDALGTLLKSKRPLDVVVSSEALGDLVAYADSKRARRLAISYLTVCRSEIARIELEEAREMSVPLREEEANKPDAPPFIPIMYYRQT